MSGPDLTPIGADEAKAPKPQPSVKLIVPAAEPVEWPKFKEERDKDGKRKPFKQKLPPPRVWEYRMADSSLYGVTARWDFNPPHKVFGNKLVIPCVYAEIEGEQRWAWAGFGSEDGCRPLLGLMELAAKPLATVLLVEGEKTRDAAPRYMPDNWVCVTWQGGGKAIHKSDWMPLAGRRVVEWMDKDPPPTDKTTGAVRVDPKTGKPLLPPGELTGRDLMILLNGIGAGVAQVPVYGPNMQMIPANGWDLADEPPDGFDPRAWLERAAQHAVIPTAKAEPAPAAAGKPQLVVDNSEKWQGPPSERGGGVDRKAEYRAVGYSKEGSAPVFHFFSGRSGFIVSMTTKELCNRTGIYQIINNDDFWRDKYNMPRGEFDKLPWQFIGARLMDECYDAGYFEVENERGRGAWLDSGRVVMHLGSHLVVDGKLINPSKMVSNYYYPVCGKLIDIKGVPALTDAEGKLLRQISRTIAWKNPFFAELFCGWIATAIVCGGWDWRTHFWLQGPSSSGKSWIVDNIVVPCVKGIGLIALGNSSAAGIMSTLGRDARPVVFDEAEGKGQQGEARRQMVIEMMRYSSSQSEGEVMKGTASHGRVGFRVQSQYFLASIGVGLSEQADLTRTVVASIVNRSHEESSFEHLKSLVKQLPSDLPERILRRQLRNLPVIKANAETFAHVISLQLGSRRLGDMIGTLMAGDQSLVSDRVIEFTEAEERIADRLTHRRFVDFIRTKDAKEDVDLLQHLTSWVVQVQGDTGGVRWDRAIGELINIRCKPQYHDDRIQPHHSEEWLRRIGMAYEKIDDVRGFWIARAKTFIATRIMASSQYSQGWDLILIQHPAAIESDKEKAFGGFRVPAVWLPWHILTMDEPEKQTTDQADSAQ